MWNLGVMLSDCLALASYFARRALLLKGIKTRSMHSPIGHFLPPEPQFGLILQAHPRLKLKILLGNSAEFDQFPRPARR